jgi:hypothetical protein
MRREAGNEKSEVRAEEAVLGGSPHERNDEVSGYCTKAAEDNAEENVSQLELSNARG